MADVRKIKVLSVEFNREYKPQGKSFTIYYFKIKTDNEMVGEFSTNSQNQTKFLIGETYEVSIETKSSRGGEYLFFDYSEAEKEKRKGNAPGTGTAGGKKGWQPYVRPRSEIMSIIAQSSFEAAVLAAIMVNKEKVNYEKIPVIADMFTKFIIDQAGLDSSLCKSGDKEALKTANDKSIVYQKALKLALQSLELNIVKEEYFKDVEKIRSTQCIINLAEQIVKDINKIANHNGL